MAGGECNLSRCLMRIAFEHLSSLSMQECFRLLTTAIFSCWNFSFKKRLQFRVQKMTSGCRRVSSPPSDCSVHTRFTNFEQYMFTLLQYCTAGSACERTLPLLNPCYPGKKTLSEFPNCHWNRSRFFEEYYSKNKCRKWREIKHLET